MIVSYQYKRRRGTAIELEHQLHDVCSGPAIEVPGRLIGEQHGRFGRKRPRNSNALLFATRKLRRIMPPAIAQTDLVDNRQRRARASAAPASSSGNMTFSSAFSDGTR